MRILCCLNRDLASNIALNLLLPSLDGHDVRVGLTDRVGSGNSPTTEAAARRELRLAEQSLPNEVFFPLIERAGLADTGIGCTLHYIADGTIDTGPIVAVARMPVAPAHSLLWHILALYPLGIGLISAALSKLNSGEPLAVAAQVATEGRYYTYPTLDEWAEFKRRGWTAVHASDLDDVFRRYGPF